MTAISSRSERHPSRRPAFARTAFAMALIATRAVTRILRHRRNARLLAGMDDRMLADIGLTRSDLRDAYAQPLWRDPTDMLAGRARDKRLNRHGRIIGAPVDAPPIAPEPTRGEASFGHR